MKRNKVGHLIRTAVLLLLPLGAGAQAPDPRQSQARQGLKLAPGALRGLAHSDSDLPEKLDPSESALCSPPSPAGWILESHCLKTTERNR